MKNKKLAVCLILVLVLQLLVPVGMIAFSTTSERDLQENGTVFKMEIRIESVYDGVLRFSFTDENYFGFLAAHLDYSKPNASVYMIMGTDAYGQGRFADCVLERPIDDLPYMRVDAKKMEELSSYEVPETVPLYFQYSEYAIRNWWNPDTAQKQDLVAEQKWYLHLLVYKGKFQVQGITDEYGNSAETQLPKLLEQMNNNAN